MPMTREEILIQAMLLTKAERERLAEELFLSLDGLNQAEVDSAWLAEIASRVAAYQRGEIGAIPVEEAIAKILSKVQP